MRGEKARARKRAKTLAQLAGASAWALVGGTSLALADAPRCDSIAVDHDDGFSPAWREAIVTLRAQLSTLAPQECAPLSLEVRRDPGGARLRARASDGRMAERIVREPSSLVAFALGLLASIPREESAAISPAPASASASASTRARPPLEPEERPPRATPPPVLGGDAARVQVALGGAIGARVGEPTGVVMADAEVRGDLVLHGWLVVASVRYAPVGARVIGKSIGAYAYDELAVGIGAGRRLELGATTLDLALVPTIVLVDEEGEVRDVTGDAASGSHSYVRLDASLRWLFARAGTWRFGVTADADVAPSAVATPPRVEPLLPAIPSWSFGLRLGATSDVL